MLHICSFYIPFFVLNLVNCIVSIQLYIVKCFVSLQYIFQKRPNENTGASCTYISSGPSHYLLCGDSLSTNFLMMKADCNHTSTDGTFNLYDSFCIRLSIKQSFIFTTWTSYMYFIPHGSTLQSMSIIIWRAKSSFLFNTCHHFLFSFFS